MKNMNIKENIALAFAGLKANKMRAFLTMLGIIIGISSVIMITTLGTILKKSITSSLDIFGSNITSIGVDYKANPVRAMPSESDLITDEMIDAFKENFSGEVTGIGLSNNVASPGITLINDEEYTISAFGMNRENAEIQNISVLKGRMISDKDVSAEKYVCLVDKDFVLDNYPDTNPVGKEIEVTFPQGTAYFTIIGIYEEKETGNNMMEAFLMPSKVDYKIIIPYTTATEINGEKQGRYYGILLQTAEGVDISKLGKDGARFMNTRYYTKNDSMKCTAQTPEDAKNAIGEVLGIVETAISVIAAISLLVGGIGVMNIMLVSVTERTKEIGIRKALGAKNSAIRIQFITEAVIICMIGGVIGIISGILMGNLAGMIIGTMASPSVSAIIVALLFSMAIGIFFGYYPANKAAKLDPIEALRYE